MTKLICTNCGHRIYSEGKHCENCGTTIRVDLHDNLPTMGEQSESELSNMDQSITQRGDTDDIVETAPMTNPETVTAHALRAEADELDKRGMALSSFLRENPAFKELPHRDQWLMVEQMKAMQAYFGYLNERIMRAENPEQTAQWDAENPPTPETVQ